MGYTPSMPKIETPTPKFSGTRLSALRADRDMTREQLARAADTTQQSIWKWETGRAAPDSNRLGRLASALGASVADFYDDDSGRPAHVNCGQEAS